MKTYTAVEISELTGITPRTISRIMRESKPKRGKTYTGPWEKRGKRPLMYTEADLKWFLKRPKVGAPVTVDWYAKHPSETPETRRERYKKSITENAGKIRDIIKRKKYKT